MASGRKAAGLLGLQVECTSVLHEELLGTVMYGSATMIWKGKKRSSIRAVLMNNLRGLLDIRRKDKVPNARIREMC